MNNQAPRFCSACRVTRPVDGGEWRTFANGLKQRWVCVVCRENAKRNKEKERERMSQVSDIQRRRDDDAQGG